MTALAVDLAVWIVAAVETGSGALWRRSFLSLVFSIRDPPASAEDVPAQFIIKFSSG
jgi:hypothetical protein